MPYDGQRALGLTDASPCFVGHSHHAFICSQSGRTEVIGEGDATLSRDDRYLINVGSVGQPRDGDPRAAMAVWDTEVEHAVLVRVGYDVEGAQAKIRSAKLPGMLADRLAMGI
jgi:diadenosine tetraphosphatase ApaH/serine/threonine PP2A family protein phosphatase